MANEPALQKLRAAIVDAIQSTPRNQIRDVSAAVVTTLHEVLNRVWSNKPLDPKPTRYISWTTSGMLLDGRLVKCQFPDYHGIETAQEFVLFPSSAKMLRERLDEIPANSKVMILYAGVVNGRKLFDVTVWA